MFTDFNENIPCSQVKLPKSTPAVKTKLLLERRRKQILAARAAKPKKAVKAKSATSVTAAKPAKTTKASEKSAKSSQKAAPAKK